jgi:FMN phosphatase YigB (HAD superfamily)
MTAPVTATPIVWPSCRLLELSPDARAAWLGVRKPEPLFYQLVLAAAGCPAEKVLFAGNNLQNDVTAPIAHGMRAALIRSHGPQPGEVLPGGALLIEHVRDLPALLEAA